MSALYPQKIRNVIARLILKSEQIKTRRGRPRILSDAEALNICLFVCRTGCQWSAVDGMCGISYKTAYHRFNIWSKKRLFEHAFYELASLYRQSHATLSLLVDTSHVKNVYGKQVLGSNHTDRGRKSTKVSVLSDSMGIPLTVLFHQGNRNDCRTLPHLLTETVRRHGNIESHKFLYADKGYDSKTCRIACAAKGLEANIPQKGTTHPWGGIRIRIEHVFGKIDKFRRVILRYDSSIRNFKSFNFIACSSMFPI